MNTESQKQPEIAVSRPKQEASPSVVEPVIESKELSGRELDAVIEERVFEARWMRSGTSASVFIQPKTEWTKYLPEYQEKYWDKEPTRYHVSPWVPHYSTDLNACFEAQDRFESVMPSGFVNAMSEYWNNTEMHQWADATGIHDYDSWLAKAPADMRCRAMLRALEEK